MGGKLLSVIKSFYEEASACVKICGETSEHFKTRAGLRQVCVMSTWLFNIPMDGVMREMKGKAGEVGVQVSLTITMGCIPKNPIVRRSIVTRASYDIGDTFLNLPNPPKKKN